MLHGYAPLAHSVECGSEREPDKRLTLCSSQELLTQEKKQKKNMM